MKKKAPKKAIMLIIEDLSYENPALLSEYVNAPTLENLIRLLRTGNLDEATCLSIACMTNEDRLLQLADTAKQQLQHAENQRKALGL